MRCRLLFVLFLFVMFSLPALCDTDADAESIAEIDVLKQYDGETVQKIIEDITLDYEKQMEIVKWKSQRDVVFPLLMEIEYLKKHIRDYGQMVMRQGAVNSLKEKKINNYRGIMVISWIIFFTTGIVMGLVGIKTISVFVSAFGKQIRHLRKKRKKTRVC